MEPKTLTKSLSALTLVFVAGLGTGRATKADLEPTPVTEAAQPRHLACPTYDADAGYGEMDVVVVADQGGQLWGEKVAAKRASIVGGDCRELGPMAWTEAMAQGFDPIARAPSCACAPRKGTCLQGGKPARPGTNLEPGTWSGGCVPKVCLELNGTSAWPAACGSQDPTQ